MKNPEDFLDHSAILSVREIRECEDKDFCTRNHLGCGGEVHYYRCVWNWNTDSPAHHWLCDKIINYYRTNNPTYVMTCIE